MLRSLAVALALAVVLACLTLWSRPAGADGSRRSGPPGPVQAGGTEKGGKVGVSSGSGRRTTGVRRSRPVYSSCTTLSTVWLQFVPGGGFGNDFSADEIASATGWANCTRLDDGSVVDFLTRPAPPDAGLLAASAERRLDLDLPQVSTSPPRGGIQLVGVPVWFWIGNFRPAAATATIPGLSATLSATPATTRIAITGGPAPATGDRTTIRCVGAGTPWVEGRDRPRDRSDCSHAFEWNGTFTIAATVDWNLTWTATNGQAGTLPTVSRTSTFTLTIEEGQAVTD